MTDWWFVMCVKSFPKVLFCLYGNVFVLPELWAHKNSQAASCVYDSLEQCSVWNSDMMFEVIHVLGSVNIVKFNI